MKVLKAKEKQLLEQMRSSKLSIREILGPYELPTTYKKLEELQIHNQINTQSIGFELWLARSITPAPLDLIQFAHTGGDGCYFAFITDFGNQLDLENCPIAFISPTDFNHQNPGQANFLFARNIREFLSVMISLAYAEHIRFQNIYEQSINNKLNSAIIEFNSEQTKDEIELRDKTIKTLSSELKIEPITDFYTYFKSVKKKRNSDTHLTTLDGINIKFDSPEKLIELNRDNITEYKEGLMNLNKESQLVAIRNAQYKYSYTEPSFLEFRKSILRIYKELGLEREYRIQEFEIRMEEVSNEWMNIRKQILKDER